ncbi:hypothetical protein [Nocardia sp. NRRL S-836]|uniref:hypothetical protein n=1 Tax=Nocardia sp. NRRL S-836 TaxID=1519492 RepID=UPI0006AF4AB5|nr:hypothetical protein [Nocardia sp. NRRL S-836]KOV81468.1 hypothetical protein ADL03_28960 [Nocardia sp. NRRL S-836]
MTSTKALPRWKMRVRPPTAAATCGERVRADAVQCNEPGRKPSTARRRTGSSQAREETAA